jgi:hypothetical protein
MTRGMAAAAPRPAAPSASGGAQGLSEQEAALRLAERPPFEPPASSRSYTSIVRANVFTVFNLGILELRAPRVAPNA